MKIKNLIALVFVIVQLQSAQAQNLRSFLKSCAWGVIGGASVGVVSLALENKPSESWNNVAKGASLGLYAGIAYGLYNINNNPTTYQQPDFAVVPDLIDGKVDGARIVGTVWNF